MADILQLYEARTISPNNLPKSSRINNNGDGGEPPMAKYVTHEELELNNQKMLREMDKQFSSLDKKLDNMSSNTDLKFEQVNTKFEQVTTKFEQVNTKFEKQKVWFFGTAITIITATCTIIGFLIKFIK